MYNQRHLTYFTACEIHTKKLLIKFVSQVQEMAAVGRFS